MKMSACPNAFCLFCICILCFSFPSQAGAGDYLDSAHGSTLYGVNRATTAATGYAEGNCAHCHEQHASVNSTQPSPSYGAPFPFALFNDNHDAQDDNLCLKCHTDMSSEQLSGHIVNRSYSFRAGGWVTDPMDDIEEAFSFTAPGGSAHNLDDIQFFIAGRWGYTTYSNPCVGCHNPHALQSDPPNSPYAAKSMSNRGWPVARPSQHRSTPWPRWGDDADERMSSYTSNYQAPFRFGSTISFEPDGSSTYDGSNLTDFNTFCTDCHDSRNIISSTPLNDTLIKIDWDFDKHGKYYAEDDLDMLPPYPDTFGKVLACTDCHEPHGAPNDYLIRREVNGSVLSGTVSYGVSDFGHLCRQCHKDDAAANVGQENRWEYAHHLSEDAPYTKHRCGECHACSDNPGQQGPPAILCKNCHYHGATVTSSNKYSPYLRRTF